MGIKNNIILSKTQRKVIAEIIASPSPRIVFDKLLGNPNDIAARDFLKRKKLIKVTNNGITMTDLGIQLAKEENIIDDSERLTPEGEALAFSDVNNSPRRIGENFKLLKQFVG